ncbi:hypothetical protein L873DRAFT_1845767 [Choiromyces venosus 120613-1]|uniref:Uncharacterized protein n=1 Tax=Choiromyces venosus 120613-1 TaxID=1336337 RepID=A0A3N4JBZ9_9PEZI|nr:hypothetical protein L873DRAFT_1845767 [Choiromyces venosus 120613-1]
MQSTDIMLFKFVLIALAVSQALTVPVTEKRQSSCKESLKRTPSQQLRVAYLDAEVCLLKAPTQTHLTGAVSKFDDLIKSHQLQTRLVHGDSFGLVLAVPQTVHPHIHAQKHCTTTNESQPHIHLREECGYTGTQPYPPSFPPSFPSQTNISTRYWDEAHASGKFSTSDIFDPEIGGDGTGAGRCVEAGRSAELTLHFAPGSNNVDHRLTRSINDWQSSQANIDTFLGGEILRKPNLFPRTPNVLPSPLLPSSTVSGGSGKPGI